LRGVSAMLTSPTATAAVIARGLAIMNDTVTEDVRAGATPNWSPDAPKGGRAVIRRMLSDSASTVPLFLGQTFIHSLRDVGYNNTVWAVCEHVDNAIQWGADEVRVYFRQRGRKGD